jgi:hypothetical protein
MSHNPAGFFASKAALGMPMVFLQTGEITVSRAEIMCVEPDYYHGNAG